LICLCRQIYGCPLNEKLTSYLLYGCNNWRRRNSSVHTASVALSNPFIKVLGRKSQIGVVLLQNNIS